mmetsp:Transcript_41448/g.163195  ORF Transcript_41448/g.163195 Transcript_41448/m.163195 type:complete len:84 (-) Transcript_41448:2185-2436(-)
MDCTGHFVVESGLACGFGCDKMHLHKQNWKQEEIFKALSNSGTAAGVLELVRLESGPFLDERLAQRPEVDIRSETAETLSGVN